MKFMAEQRCTCIHTGLLLVWGCLGGGGVALCERAVMTLPVTTDRSALLAWQAAHAD